MSRPEVKVLEISEPGQGGDIGDPGTPEVENLQVGETGQNILGKKPAALACGDQHGPNGLIIACPTPKLDQPSEPGRGRGLKRADPPEQLDHAPFLGGLGKGQVNGSGAEAIEVGSTGGQQSVGFGGDPEHHRSRQLARPPRTRDVQVLPHPQFLRARERQPLQPRHHHRRTPPTNLLQDLIHQGPLGIFDTRHAVAHTRPKALHGLALPRHGVALDNQKLEPRAQLDGTLKVPEAFECLSRPNPGVAGGQGSPRIGVRRSHTDRCSGSTAPSGTPLPTCLGTGRVS